MNRCNFQRLYHRKFVWAPDTSGIFWMPFKTFKQNVCCNNSLALYTVIFFSYYGINMGLCFHHANIYFKLAFITCLYEKMPKILDTDDVQIRCFLNALDLKKDFSHHNGVLVCLFLDLATNIICTYIFV